MDIFQYDPTAPATRYSNAVRFRSVNPGADANRKSSATKQSVDQNEDGKCLNTATGYLPFDAVLERQGSTTDHETLDDNTVLKPRDCHEPSGGQNGLSDDSESDSDDHGSLHNLFSGSLDIDSADTKSSLGDNPTTLEKKLAEETDPASERLRAGDSPGQKLEMEIVNICVTEIVALATFQPSISENSLG